MTTEITKMTTFKKWTNPKNGHTRVYANNELLGYGVKAYFEEKNGRADLRVWDKNPQTRNMAEESILEDVETALGLAKNESATLAFKKLLSIAQ